MLPSEGIDGAVRPSFGDSNQKISPSPQFATELAQILRLNFLKTMPNVETTWNQMKNLIILKSYD